MTNLRDTDTHTHTHTVNNLKDPQDSHEEVQLTMAIQGFQKVKASIMCDRSVVTTASITHTTFRPVLSTRNPSRGDAGAEMMYTILQNTESEIYS